MGSRAKKLIFHLDLKTDDVRFIGVWGIAGIGKTAIAAVVCMKLRDQFDGYYFLYNERVRSQQQNDLLERLKWTRGMIFISGVRLGLDALLRNRIFDKKVLIVLDDEDELDQIADLAEDAHDWSGKGRRIIVTTRDMNLLTFKGVDTVYTCEGLNHDEATQLFCLRAFGQKIPLEGSLEFVNAVLEYANGNPLALEVMCDGLDCGDLTELETRFKGMHDTLEKNIFDTFQISFDSLDEESKNLFLHIACFFQGKKVDRVQRVEDCSTSTRTSTNLVLSFMNCHKLKQNQGRKCMIVTRLKAYLQPLLKSQTSKQKEEKSQNQELSDISGRLDIIIPATRIPEWVRYQKMGPSVRVHLLPRWNNNNWIGFVFCVVIGAHEENADVGHDNHQIEGSENSHEITCQLFTNEGSFSMGFGFCISSGTYFESDHVWLRYVSNGSFRERMRQWHKITYIDALFRTESQYLEVKKCGFRAVYKQDLQELKREFLYVHPPTQDLGAHFFSF